MFRYFENLIDPYSEYTQTDTPPTTLWAFLRGYCRPFYGVLVLMTVTEISIAALELGVIFGVGWFVDVIHTTPNLIVDYAVPGLISLAVFYLLHRSVRDNIRYGRQNATQAEILAASKQAVAHDFIVDLKDLDGNSGYEALVGERGVKLSGGERQRISLARVILKNAPILLLDEATSALDSEIEAEILNTLYGMMQGKTVIAIAHRLSTIARMDRIIVMDNGSIVENGPHEALLAQNGQYATFWARQSGGFIDIKAVI